MRKLLIIILFSFLAITNALPVFAQANVNRYVGATFGLGSDDTASRIIAGVQWAIGIASLITIVATIFSFIMSIILGVRLKRFDTQHKLDSQQDYAKLNPNDAQERSAIKKKLRIYRIITSAGVFMMIILLILWSMVIFRIQ